MARDRLTVSDEYTARVEFPRGPTQLLAPLSVEQPDTSAVAAAAGKFGEGLKTFAAEVHKKSEAHEKASDVTNAVRARLDFGKGVREIYARYEADPDFQTAPKRFRDDVEELHSRVLGTITDETRRLQTELQLQPQRVQAERAIDLFTTAREADFNQKALPQRRSDARRISRAAGSDVEVDETVRRFDGETQDWMHAGWITPQRATAEARLLRSEIVEDKLERGIAANPAAIASALGSGEEFEFLDPVAHARLTEAAYQAEAAAAPAAQAETEARAFRAARDGTLDAAIAADDALPGSVQLRLAQMIGPRGPASVDGPTYARLLGVAVDDARGALIEASDEFAAGRIGRAEFNKVYDTAQRFAAEIANRPHAIDNRRDLIAALTPSANAPSQTRALDLALAAYDAWIDGNPDADAGATRGEMLRLTTEARATAAREDRATLPLPRFASAPRETFDASALAAAAERLRDAQHTLSDDELSAHAELLKRWRDVVSATAKGGK